MEVKATSKYMRISPEKLRFITNGLKKNFSAGDCLIYLSQLPQKGGLMLAKTLKQAIANAANNHGGKVEELKIKQIRIDGGPFLKRFKPVSRGMAHPMVRRMSHITVVLETPDPKKRLKGAISGTQG
mgnify:CR=1 FL=1